MRRQAAIMIRYVWLTLALILLLIGETHCAGVSSQTHQTQTAVPSALEPTVVPTAKIKLVEGWTSLNRQVRDVQILESFVLLSNSAPWWGQGPEDGKPYIAAFDLRAQEIVWELEHISEAPIATNSRNLFIVEKSRLVALDLNSGNEIWSVPFTSSGLSQMFSDNDLVLAANGETLYAFNAANGELQWESHLPAPLDPSVPLFTSFASWRDHGALAKHGHTVYARTLDYHDTNECRFSVVALDADSGSERWRFPIQQPSHGECLPGTLPLAFGDGLVLVGTWDNAPGSCVLNALNENSGEVVWGFQITDNCSTATYSIFLDSNIVLISTESILVLQAQDGRLLQQENCLPGGPHQLIASEGWAVCRSGDTSESTHSIIDLRSGRELERLNVSPPESCKSASSMMDFSDGQLVLVVGNCIRSFSVGTER